MATDIKTERKQQFQFENAYCATTGWPAVYCPVCDAAKKLHLLHVVGTAFGPVAYVILNNENDRWALEALLERNNGLST